MYAGREKRLKVKFCILLVIFQNPNKREKMIKHQPHSRFHLAVRVELAKRTRVYSCQWRQCHLFVCECAYDLYAVSHGSYLRVASSLVEVHGVAEESAFSPYISVISLMFLILKRLNLKASVAH